MKIITLMLLGLVSEIACKCNQCVSLIYYSCEVCYNSCQEYEKFVSCSHTYCDSYSQDSNGTLTCNSYTTIRVSEQQCFSICCGSSTNATKFSVGELEKCKKQNTRLHTIIISVVCSVFGVILLIFLGFMCCSGGFSGSCGSCGGCSGCNCHRLGNCLGAFCQCFVYFITCCFCCEHLRRINVEKKAEVSMFSEGQIMIPQWQAEEVPQQTLEDSYNCAICLSNKIDTITSCGHEFHLSCFYEWSKRKSTCPLCISQKINPIKFYCRSCCMRFVLINLQPTSTVSETMAKIKGPNCPNCQ